MELISFLDLDTADIHRIWEWRNHASIRQWMYTSDEITLENHLAFVSNLKGKSDRSYFLGIEESQEKVGVVSFTDMNRLHGHCRGGIYVSPYYNGPPGVGMRLLEALMQQVFLKEGMNCLRMEVLTENLKAERLYRKAGFIEEGVYREYVLFPKRCDVKIYSILKEEYVNRKS